MNHTTFSKKTYLTSIMLFSIVFNYIYMICPSLTTSTSCKPRIFRSICILNLFFFSPPN